MAARPLIEPKKGEPCLRDDWAGQFIRFSVFGENGAGPVRASRLH
ncbi:hypothetical protein CES85_3398 (plasmid) [Ochrobactrum quorumnocens]|uniref:Uncharacterized protein n=1 Tax=Ochrobactrum quorumnocens TaxID=271865 RepID=A0A248UP04_9HYPH|nr:hypothetical protein CES85_3398 [[Ochrobactrum] quorumnocens]